MYKFKYFIIKPYWKDGNFLFSLLHEHVDLIFYQSDQIHVMNIKANFLTIIQTTSDKAIQLVKSVKLIVWLLENLTRPISETFKSILAWSKWMKKASEKKNVCMNKGTAVQYSLQRIQINIYWCALWNVEVSLNVDCNWIILFRVWCQMGQWIFAC